MIGGEAMLRAVKSYLAFANSRYKLCVLVILPVLLVVVNVNVLPNEARIGMDSLRWAFMFDVVSEIFFMRGLYSKNNSALGFMQCSSKFCETINKIVIIDFVRRAIVCQIPVLMVLWRSIGDEAAMECCRALSFMSWMVVLVTQIAVWVVRHSASGRGMLGSCILGGIVLLIIQSVVEMSGGVAAGVVFIPIVLVFAVVVVTVWYTDKKMKESYYD